MSVQYCEYCNKYIDTDFNAEHFDCSDDYQCVEEQAEEEQD